MAGRRRLMFAKDFSVDYLRFTALESGTFTLTIDSTVTTSNLEYVEYSTDEGETWVKTNNVSSQTVTITTPTITTGNSVLWRGKATRMSQNSSTLSRRSTFSSTGRCNVSGNINTLLKLDKPKEQTGYLSNYAFRGLFYQMTKLVDASGLVIPKAGSYAFQRMFYGCTALTNPPTLPEDIGTSNTYCCSYMFYGCTALQKAPALPSINLSNYCYEYMFQNCNSLTQAPQLPATTLNNSCYAYMFQGCTSLVTAPTTLPAETLKTSCYFAMFKDCASLVTAPEIFGRNSANSACNSMFNGCSSLTSIKTHIVSWGNDVTSFTTSWVSGVASSGTFYKSPLLNIESGDSRIPNGWVVENYDEVTSFNPINTFTPSGYVTFVHSNIIYVGLAKKFTNQTIYLSKNGTTWHNLQDTDVIKFEQNENCYVCGNLTSDANYDEYTQFAIGGAFSLSGNCNAIWNYSNLSANLRSYCGRSLFAYCVSLTSVSDTFLPSMNLAVHCYRYLFASCTNLTTVPALPATTLTANCYAQMFYGCSSITATPSLSATTLAEYCYYSMFNSCTALTTIPNKLPATTTQGYCYYEMFIDCTNITTAPELPATTLANQCYSYMFDGCSSLSYIKALIVTLTGSTMSIWVRGVASTGIFVKHIDATWEATGVSYVPTNWTILYFDPDTEKYYLSDKTTECDDHGNPL